MTGFKNFVLRGNLVDLAVAVIIGTAFGAVVTTFTDWLTGLMPESARQDLQHTRRSSFGAFLNAVISFLILAAVVYFFVVLPYTKAKEKYFPSEEPGTPDDIALLEEIRDLLGGRSSLTRRRLSRWDQTAARSAVVRAGPGRAARRRAADSPGGGCLGVALVAGRLGQHVAEDRGQPAARAAHVGSRRGGPAGSRLVARGPSLTCRAPRRRPRRRRRTALASAGGAAGDGPAVGVDRRARRSEPGGLAGGDRVGGQPAGSGSSLRIFSQTACGLGRPHDPVGVAAGPRSTGSVRNWTLPRSMCAELDAELGDLAEVARGRGSTVSDLVAALRKRSSRSGLVSVPAEMTLLAIEATNACCRFIRPMSEPSPTAYRCRT